MSFANIGALSSPPVGGLVYSQAGIVGVAVVSLAVLTLDLIMQISLLDILQRLQNLSRNRPPRQPTESISSVKTNWFTLRKARSSIMWTHQ